MDTADVHPGSQGTIHMSIVADPSNANLVYIGGDRQSITPFPGNLWRGDASNSLGSQFVRLTNAGTASNSAPHADSREMMFDANGNIIQTDDGGVYRRTSPQTNSGDWFSINGDLQTTEFHDAAYDSNSNIMFGGTQDNGTPVQDVPGLLTWSLLQGGDGGDVQVDDTSSPGLSIRYTSSQFLGSFVRTTWNASNQLQAVVFPSLTVIAGGASLSAGFYTPVELNAVDPMRLVIGAANSVYESLNQGSTIREIGPGIGSNNLGRNTLAYGAAGNTDILYVGSGSNVYVRTAAQPAPLVQSAAYPGSSSVLGVVLDPDDPLVAFALDSQNVFHTSDGGASWTNVTGNLLSLDPGQLRTLEYVSQAGDDGLVVGADRGVFSALDSGSFDSWQVVGTGFPNAPVFDLDYDADDDILTDGTLGRGAWTKTPPLSGGGNAPPSVSITSPANGSSFLEGTEITFTGTASDPEQGNLTASIAWTLDGNPIGTGGTVTATPSVGAHTVVASVTDNGNLTTTDTISVSVTPGGTLLSEDFEGDVSGWVGNGLWHLVDNSNCAPGFSSPTHAFYYGQDTTCNYNTGGTNSGNLVSPPVAGITADSVLTFDYRRQVESFNGDFDRTAVDISTDGGNTWTEVFKLNATNTSQNAWVTSSIIPLASFAGETILIRFRFESVDAIANNFVGWFIDDVTVLGGGGGNQPPQVTITAPANGATFVEGTEITFTGTAIDPEDGNLTPSIEWEADGNSIGMGGTVMATLAIGDHTITASATDGGNLTTTDTITVTVVANQPPQVMITSPANGATFPDGTEITFTGTASDPEQGNLTASIAWTLDGNPIGTGGTVMATPSVGAHTVVASVTDNGNLTATDTITITVLPPNQPPQVTITSPANGSSFLEGTEITFMGTASDPEQGNLTASIAWTLDGNPIGTGGTVMATPSVGAHTVVASVTDNGNLTTTDTISVSVTPGGTLLSEDFEGDVSGWVGNGLWHLVDNSNCAPGFSSPTHAFYYGQDTTCNYNTGSTNSGNLVSPPVAGITADSVLTFDYRRQVESFNGDFDRTAVDISTDGGNTWTEVFKLNATNTSQNAWVTSSIIPLASFAGETILIRFRFESVDAIANNFVGWFIDDVTVLGGGGGNQPPQVTITAPANGATFVEGTEITFTGTAIDPEDGNLTPSIEWEADGNSIGMGGTVMATLAIGDHTITASATDGGNLTTTDTITVTVVANQPPQVMITSPANGATFPDGTEITFTGTASDPEQGNLTASIAWTLDGNPIGTGGTVMATPSVGAHTVVASVTDNGNLTTTDTISVSVTPGGTLLSEDFEGDVSGWVRDGLWHLVDNSNCAPGFSSPTHAFYYGQDTTCNYNTGGTNSGNLVSPPVAGITADSVLTFDYRRQVESFNGDFDRTAVDISTDGGNTWTEVFKLNATNTSQNAWVTSSIIPLASFAGETILIRFRFESVDAIANNFVGWFIDDVEVFVDNQPLSIVEETLADGAVNTPYSVSLNATGGLPPYQFTLESGGLPTGLTLAPSGAISGDPTWGETTTFTVRVEDANLDVAMRELEITISPFVGADFGHPYLQNSTMDGITVHWWTPTDRAGLLEYGVGSFDTSVISSPEPVTFTRPDVGSDVTRYRHEVRLSSLTADAGYQYRVTQDAIAFVSQFETAPAETLTPIRFVVWADTETELASHGSLGSGAPPGYPMDQNEGIMAGVLASSNLDPDFILIAGDIVEQAGRLDDWDELFRKVNDRNPVFYTTVPPLASRIPIFAALGNHDYYGFGFSQPGSEIHGVHKYLEHFDNPSNTAPTTIIDPDWPSEMNPTVRAAQDERYFAFDYGPATVIGIDVNNQSPDGSSNDTNFNILGENDLDGGFAPDWASGSRQYQWLEEQLLRAQASSPFTFVYWHHAAFSSGPHALPPGIDDQSGLPTRQLDELFHRYRVTAVFNGHEEMVEMSETSGDSGKGGNPNHVIRYFVAGSMGDGIRDELSSLLNPSQVFHYTDSTIGAPLRVRPGGYLPQSVGTRHVESDVPASVDQSSVGRRPRARPIGRLLR